jgi:pimeloyl-ACP methyl ester carboxylesterase
MRVDHARVRGLLDLAYWHAGRGGVPLLLVHGWPETKRIWQRTVEPLAAAGFEVIVPDLRGFGDSDLAPDGFYDPAVHARDLHALVGDALGHPWCVAAAGDLGGVVVQDLGLRFPGFVVRQCIFNTLLPMLDDAYAAAGIPPDRPRPLRPESDYFIRQATDADGLAAELDTPARRRRYIETFYTSRFWAAPGAFTADDLAFHVEPFLDAARFRASIANYEPATGRRPVSEPARFFEPSPVPTLVLYGPEDHVVDRTFLRKAEVAFPERVGPFVVPVAGHFLQWERAEVFSQAMTWFCRDLTTRSPASRPARS